MNVIVPKGVMAFLFYMAEKPKHNRQRSRDIKVAFINGENHSNAEVYMAKIDTTKIQGYAEMTAEEKLAALEAFDMPEPDFTGYVKKDLLDKATSEAAQYKKSLREKMTEEEAAKAKAAEDMASVMAELESLRSEKAISEYTAQFMGIGYGEELAKATAIALQAGDTNAMFKNHAKFVVEKTKEMKAELLKGTPTPPAGDGAKTMTRADFSKLSLDEKAKFAAENPEAYKEIYKGE